MSFLKNAAFYIVAVIMILALALESAPLDTVSYDADDLIRIHIVANSDSERDMCIKAIVRDNILDYIEKNTTDIKEKSDIVAFLNNSIDALNAIITDTLEKENALLEFSIKLKNEAFPLRLYDDVLLKSGQYDALVITLGDGLGENWWCIAFPPLCYQGRKEDKEKVKLKSRISEFFSNVFSKNKEN